MHTENKTEKLTMSVFEASKALGVSRATAYSLARRNELPVPVIFVGHRRMVLSRAAVMALLAERKAVAESGNEQA
jgi:excisionase family DNA binding protein